MDSNYEKLSLHFKYFVFMAFMLVVAIATEKWSESKDFTMYLSNAATMSSLMLGVVAIFYSFISNDGMSKSLGSISTVSTEVREIRGEIEQFSNLTQDATRESTKNTGLVREASTVLSESLSQLSVTLNQISTQNDSLKGLITALPVRLDQLETRFDHVAKAVGEKPQTSQNPTTNETVPPSIVEGFLGRASLYQNLLAHACVLAVASKKPLSITAFCKAVDLESPNTFTGFLGCMNAVQLCIRKTLDLQSKTYTVSAVDPTLASISKSYFVDYINETYSADPKEKDQWLKKLSSVEGMFTEA